MTITPARLAELQAMPRDPNSSYAVVNREDFEGLLAAAEAVLNPPPDVAEAMGRIRKARADSEDHDGGYPATAAGRFRSQIDHAMTADWYMKLLTPAAKETT